MAGKFKKKLKSGVNRLLRRSTDSQLDQEENNLALHTSPSRAALEISELAQRSLQVAAAPASLPVIKFPNDRAASTGVAPESIQFHGGSQLMPLDQVDKHESWGIFKMSVDALSKVSGVFGPLKEVVGSLVSFMDAFQTITENQEGYQRLRAQLAPLLNVLKQHDIAATPPSIAESIAELGLKIKEEIDNVEQSRHTGGVSRLWNAEQDAEMLRKCYEIIQTHIQGFAVNAKIDEWKITIERETVRVTNVPMKEGSELNCSG
ncbi:hypothetical protein FRC07_001568 [Ceratobasidium sp. 392]|nr:hypothetical protein FRC07_001568 [Ceratobasidium sp. 392]